MRRSNRIQLPRAWLVCGVCFVGLLLIGCATSLHNSTKAPIAIAAPWSPTAVRYICDSNKTEPTYEGMPISQWIQAKTLVNTNRLSLTDLLTLKQTSAPDDWGIVNFEAPIEFETRGDLHLGVINKEGEFVVLCFEGCERATNGRCQLWWNSSYDPPRKHNLRAMLTCYNHLDSITVIGPPLTYYSSNACQFFEAGSMYDDTGAFLSAKTREQVATYRIELRTDEGKHINMITGSTTNGLIDLEWDLTDDHGKKFQGSSFDGLFHITYPGNTHTNAPAKKRFTKFRQ